MSDAPDNLVLAYLCRLETRMDQPGRDQLSLHQAVSTNLQYTQRLGARLDELRDDLEVILKAEVTGASLG